MQAYRTHAKVEEGQVVVQLPEAFAGTEVEVIVLPSESAPAMPKTKKNMSKYRGVLKTGLSRETIDKQLQNLRDEWERPI
ncbi:MAG: hypothetical protein KIS77_15960 [Saprospiraceae bacterium]|nr:hypothetical protein [Saprospiraceae bacterium]